MSFGNYLKTAVLLAALTGIMLVVGYLLGGTTGLTVAIVLSVLINTLMYFFSGKLALAMYHAKEIKEKDAPRLYKLVREVCQTARVPMPRVYIIKDASPNAFATGRNPKHAAVACTEGILDLLSDHELKGVIAHEIGHIRNRDILIATIAATIAGIISYVASIAQWTAIFGGGDDDGQNIITLLLLAILAPLIALIIQLAISRSREYLADATAAKTLHDGKSLATALKKLDESIAKTPLHNSNQTGASLFIANPFSARGLVTMFSTHPPIKERISRLEKMKY